MSIKHLIYRKGGVPGATAKHRQLLQSEDYDYSGATEPIEVESTSSEPEKDTGDEDAAISNSGTTEEDPYTFVSKFKITEKTPGILKGITNKTKQIVDLISSGVGSEVVLTSGLRSPEENSSLIGNAKDSFHLAGQAVDIRVTPETNAYFTSPAAKEALSAQGYEIVDERNLWVDGVQIPPHWHIEPSPIGSARRGGLIYKR